MTLKDAIQAIRGDRRKTSPDQAALNTRLSNLALEWFDRGKAADPETPEGAAKREAYFTAVEELGETVYPDTDE